MAAPFSTRLRDLFSRFTSSPAAATPDASPVPAVATESDPAIGNAGADSAGFATGGDGAATAAAPSLDVGPIPGAAQFDSTTTILNADGTPSWVSSRGPFPPDRAFDFGTIDGSREIEKVHFEGYLEKSVDEELGRAQLAEVEAEAAMWRAREAETLGASADVVRTEQAVIAAEAAVARSEAMWAGRVARAESERDRKTEEAKSIESDVRNVRGGRGSWVFAALYIAAAAVFIVGDIGIAESTVADGLELTGWHGAVFAVGLGLLSVLLKPVYDRLVEDPYHDGETSLFKRVITTVSILTLGALLVLGYFRSESYVARKGGARAASDMDDIEGQISEVQGDPSRSEAERASEIGRLEAELDSAAARQVASTEGLMESTSGRMAFILSGVLFAVAGAVCLGIGLKHVHDWYYLRRLPSHRARLLHSEAARAEAERAAAAAASETAPALTERLPELRAAAEAARARASETWPLDLCRERLTAALDTRSDYIAAASAARREKLVHLYRDGYELGLKNPADYDGGLKSEGASDGTEAATRRHRPFLELRRAIARQTFGAAPADPSTN